MADWFQILFGFREGNAESVKRQFQVSGTKLRSNVNKKEFTIGEFSTPSLKEVKNEATRLIANARNVEAAGLRGSPSVEIASGDVAELHRKSENCLALFQVASQLNCLEFVSPSSTPEMGITGYSGDRTQGPCCAIACGAGTVFRNYYVPVHDVSGKVVQMGQSEGCQIECLRDFSSQLDNSTHRFFEVKGGYTLAEDRGLTALNKKIDELGEAGKDSLRACLRLGVQKDVQVTSFSWGRQLVNDPRQLVTQVFGSACSVAYSGNSAKLWEPLARLILEASYEATLWTAVCSALRHKGAEGSQRVFLTALGGGVFGNSMSWVADAIDRAVRRVCVDHGLALRVFLVWYAPPVDRTFDELVQRSLAGGYNKRQIPFEEPAPPVVAKPTTCSDCCQM